VLKDDKREATTRMNRGDARHRELSSGKGEANTDYLDEIAVST